jgi:glycosyltransferase involved in cell wall biosynthesis
VPVTRHNESNRSRGFLGQGHWGAVVHFAQELLKPSLRNRGPAEAPPDPAPKTGRPEATIAEEFESHAKDGISRQSGNIRAMPELDRGASKPLVTIVTPSFNQGEFIADAIDSVLTQDYPAIEYMVVDGGSTDSTLAVLRGYGDRVRWTSGPDGGQSDAIHRGFLAGSGEYIAWLNSDDRYVPGAISAAVAELAIDPTAGLLYGRGEFVDRGGAVIGPCAHVEPWNLLRLIASVNFVLQPATVFRRDAYMAIGGIDTALHYVMDYDLWIRLGSKFPVRFLPRVLAQARIHGETKTETGGLPRMEEMERMIRRNSGRGLPSSYRREMWLALRDELDAAANSRQPARAIRLGARTAPYAARAAIAKLRRVVSDS